MEGRTRGGLDARPTTRPDHLTSAGEPIRASEWLLLRITILGTRIRMACEVAKVEYEKDLIVDLG